MSSLWRSAFAAASILVLLQPGTSLAGTAPETVEIDVSGAVPGFSQAELAAYLAKEMQLSAGTSWRFTAGPAAATAPNRIVWSFKSLREVWKGAFHSGFPSRSHSETYLSTEAKLYLNGAYQMTMSTEPTVLGGTSDATLAGMVQHVAQAMFVENR